MGIQLDQNIPEDWNEKLIHFTKSEKFKELERFLKDEYRHQTIYPPQEDLFTAFKLTPFNKTKVVIIGQDPYHGEGQAHGLAFSVQKEMKVPPSLKNIYKEIQQEFNYDIPSHGNLSSWAGQGVLLLNNVLSVRAKSAGSHQKKGWENFTDEVIKILNREKENLVFLLWGSPAQKKCKIVDESKHLVLRSVHPSPLSAYRGFFGNNHFTETNKYLKKIGMKEINWQVS